MKKRFSQVLLLSIIAIIVVALPFVTSCSSSSSSPTPTATTPASTPTQTTAPATSASPSTSATPAAASQGEVRIGIMGGQSGPAQSSVVPMLNEMVDVFKYVNDVQGGIDGIKLSWKIEDNHGTPDGAIAAYKDLRDTFHPQIFVAVEDYYYAGIKDMIDQDKAVFFTTAAIMPSMYQPVDRFFSIAIPTSDGFAGWVKWVQQNWTGTGKPKIGVLNYDLASGDSWKAAIPWLMKQGYDYTSVSYPITTVDLKTQLMRLRDANVNAVWMLGITPSAAVAVRDMNSLGLTDKFSLTFNEYIESDVLQSLAGAGAKGFTIVRSKTPYADNTQAAKLYNTIWKTEQNKDKWSDNRLSISLLASITAAVKQAKADVGANNITSDSIYNALNKLVSIDTWGNSQGFGYGPDRRIGVQTMKISKMTGATTGPATVSASDFITMPRTFEGLDK